MGWKRPFESEAIPGVLRVTSELRGALVLSVGGGGCGVGVDHILGLRIDGYALRVGGYGELEVEGGGRRRTEDGILRRGLKPLNRHSDVIAVEGQIAEVILAGCIGLGGLGKAAYGAENLDARDWNHRACSVGYSARDVAGCALCHCARYEQRRREGKESEEREAVQDGPVHERVKLLSSLESLVLEKRDHVQKHGVTGREVSEGINDFRRPAGLGAVSVSRGRAAGHLEPPPERSLRVRCDRVQRMHLHHRLWSIMESCRQCRVHRHAEGAVVI